MTHPETFAVVRTDCHYPASMVLRLSGELDVTGVAVLESEIALALDRRPATVVLDLSDLSFLDASGVGAIARGIARARRQGTTVAARAPQGIVRRVLRLIDFDSVLTINDGSATAAPMPYARHPAGTSTDGAPAAGNGPDGAFATPTESSRGARQLAGRRGGAREAERPSGFARGDHVCWVYEGETAFTTAAVEYLAEGLHRGEQLLYAADRPAAVLAEELSPLGEVSALVNRGVLSVRSLRDIYIADRPFDPTRQVAHYRQLTEAALAAGYRGLRVAVDATTLVTTSEARAEFLGCELAVDGLLTRAPMTAMCAYSSQRLGAAAAAELACVHPSRFLPGGPSFRLFAGESGWTMAGEIDLTEHARLRAALQAALAASSDEDLTIDLAPLEFIDAAGLAELSSLACALGTGQRVALVGASAIARRCWQILDLERPGRVELR